MKRVLVTGVAGFIGYFVTEALLKNSDHVIGVDNLNDYYDVSLKQARLNNLHRREQFEFWNGAIEDREGMAALFSSHAPTHVVHLAAQAGVRYSIQNPNAYVDSNLVGMANVLEGCRHAEVEHLVFASSSSVYGNDSPMPFSEDHDVSRPLNLYAATKKANELMAHAYSHLYTFRVTGLRFFTVYGPWGRPDMAIPMFTRSILSAKPIQVYNGGNMRRDFTYVDDIVEGILRVLDTTPDEKYRIFNIGKGEPVGLMDMIHCLESELGVEARLEFLPLQPEDALDTWADTSRLQAAVGYRPSTDIHEGIHRFVTWYRDYYHVRAA